MFECNDTVTNNLTLTSDFYCPGSNGIIIGADNLTINCNDHTISGNGNLVGINITNHDWITIKDCNISNFEYGVFGNHTNYVSIYNNNFTNNNYGVYLEDSNYTNITRNVFNNTVLDLYIGSHGGYVWFNYFYGNGVDLDNISNYFCVNETIAGNLTEIGNLYSDSARSNNNLAQTECDAAQPVITLVAPDDNYIIDDYYLDGNNDQIKFQFNVSDLANTSSIVGLQSCTVYIDGVGIESSGSITNNATNEIAVDSVPANGNYSWYITCNDLAYFNNKGVSATRYFNVSSGLAPPPTDVWDLPNATKNAQINVYGMFNQTNLSAMIYAVQNYPVYYYFNRTEPVEPESLLLGSAPTTVQAESTNSTTFYVEKTFQNEQLFQQNNYVEFTTHDRTYWMRYRITQDPTDLLTDLLVNISPALEDNVALGTEVYVYAEAKPTGWFNGTIPLWQNESAVYVKGKYPGATPGRKSPDQIIFYDNIAPWFDLSNIGTVVQGNQTLYFNVIDNYGLNLDTLLLNMTNLATGNSVYHMYSGSDVFNFTPQGNDITCNAVVQDTNYFCSVEAELTNVTYSLNFTINDSVDNAGIASKELQVLESLDTSDKLIVYDGEFIGSVCDFKDVASTSYLCANWTNLTAVSTLNITDYFYAVGINPTYLGADWNSVRDWTNVSQNLSVDDTFPLTPGTVYYFHVRARTNFGNYTSASTSDGILYQDTTAPQCPSGTCIIVLDAENDSLNQLWVNSVQSLRFMFNFTDNQSTIDLYTYAIGENPYPQPDYESQKNRTETTNIIVNLNDLNFTNNGTYYVSAKAKNEFNLWGEWKSEEFKADLISPFNGSIQYPALNRTNNKTTLTLNSGTDNESGLFRCQIWRSKEPIQLDYSCPQLSSYTKLAEFPCPSTTMTHVADTEGGYCYNFKYRVYDIAGNYKDYLSGLDYFLVDTTPPGSFTVVANDGNFVTYAKSLWATWTQPSDPESGIDYYWYRLIEENTSTEIAAGNTTIRSIYLTNLNLTHLEDYYFNVTAYNPLGLFTSSVSNSVLYFDNTPPEPVTVTQVENDTNSTDGWLDLIHNNQTNITVQDNEPLGGCVYSLYDIDYSTIFGNSCDYIDSYHRKCLINTTAQGYLTYYITCKDAHGNEQTADQNTQVNFEVDTLGPNITIITPNNETVGGNVLLKANVTEYDPNLVDKSWFEINFTSNGSLKTSGNLSPGSLFQGWWDTSSQYEIDPENFTITVFANDTRGHVSSATANFTVDNSRPYILFIPSEHYTNESFNLSIMFYNFINASYNITNSTGYILQSGSLNQTTWNESFNWTVFVDITGLPDTIYYINAYAKGNGSETTNETSETSWFIVDTVLPVYANASNRSADNSEINNDDSVMLSIDWYDINLDWVRIEHNANGSLVNYTPVQGSWLLNISPSELQTNETVTWRSIAADRAGQTVSTPLYSFLVVNRIPIHNTSKPSFTKYEDLNATMQLDDYFYDLDLDDLNFTAVNATNISVIINNSDNTALVISDPDYYGQQDIIFTANDSFSITNANITIIVQGVNDPPVWTIVPNQTMIKNRPKDVNLSNYVSDIDSTGLMYNYTNGNVIVTFDNNIATITPTTNFTGIEFVIFTAYDLQNESSSNSVTLNITTPDLYIRSISESPDPFTRGGTTTITIIVDHQFNVTSLNLTIYRPNGENNTYNITQLANVSLATNVTKYLLNYSNTNTVGTYNIAVYASDNKSNFDNWNSSFTTTAKATPTGGGGGGGGTAARRPSGGGVGVSALYEPGLIVNESPIIRTCLAEDQIVAFYIKKNIKTEAKVTGLHDDYVTMTIGQAETRLERNQSVMIDSDSNGINDVRVWMYTLGDYKGCFWFYELREAAPVVTPPPAYVPPAPPPEEPIPPEEERPAPVIPVVEEVEKEGFFDIYSLYIIIAIVTLAGIIVGSLAVYRFKFPHKVEAVREIKPTITEKPALEIKKKPLIKPKISPFHLKELEKYIFHAKSRGFSDEQIKNALTQKGWREEIVSEALGETEKFEKHIEEHEVHKPTAEEKARESIKKLIAKGYTEEKIKHAMIIKGWKPEAVEKIFAELK
ncbi:RecX family transcriptional regulator [Candidatus Woesearchaeota archaeon]|nr:RecX family transcriptional regulator [Candidatus Woesearchaeota archaeon]